MFIGMVLKLQNKFIRVEDVHPHHVCQSVKGVTRGIVINLRKTVYINVYLHVNLTLLKIKTENKYNSHYCHVPIHFPYLPCQFSVASSPSFFLPQFCGLISQSCQQNTSQTSPLLHLNDLKTKFKLK